MLFILALLTFAALPFGAFAVLYSHQKDQHYWAKRDNPNAVAPTYKLMPAIAASVAIAALVFIAESLTVIPAGHIGVQVTFGQVNPVTLTEGMHFINPLSSVKNVEVRVVTTKLNNSSAGTKDLQQVHTDIVLNYRLDGSKAGHIYKEFGLDLQDRVILPGLNESFKAVTAHYSSEELITKRDEVSLKIREEVAAKLAKYNIEIGDISLVNFGFSAEYQKAIEEKVIATQAKLKAEQDLSRIEVEAKQTIAKAEGRAKAIQIETQAINSQGGANYVQLKAIEKWDGKLPNLMSGNSTPFVNVK